MAKNREIKNSHVFQRLVNNRYKDSVSNGIKIPEISNIEKRSRTIIQNLNAHYKKHYNNFVAQETYRQMLKRQSPAQNFNPPGVSINSFKESERVAKHVVNARFRMKLLKTEQAAERMQLRAISNHKQVDMVTKAHRIKERGATLKNKLRTHHRKHQERFVNREHQKLISKQDKSVKVIANANPSRTQLSLVHSDKIRQQAVSNVSNRHHQRLERVEQVAQAKYTQMLKRAKQSQRQ